MTDKRFKVHIIWHNYEKTKGEIELKDRGQPILISDRIDDVQWIKRLLNELHEENEQLKQDRFICLDCKHSGYTEIGCLCEKKDHWTDYKTECEDYEELE